MNFLSVKQYSTIWEISERRIIKLCTEGRIPGAVKNGKSWNIPENTMKPADKRNNVAKYINTEKRVAIYDFDKRFGYKVISLLEQAGFIVDIICNKTIENVNLIKAPAKDLHYFENIELTTNKYYEHLIIMESDTTFISADKIRIVEVFAKKMNCNSSIVYVNTKPCKELNFVKELAPKLKNDIGVRINAIKLTVQDSKDVVLDYDELANDIVDLTTKFKNTTGMIIETDASALELRENRKSKILSEGAFYKAIDNCLKNFDKQSYFWSASTMLEDEWTEEPQEMKFRVSNLEVANRGSKVERIFVFSHSKIQEFKNNKTLRVFMQNNIDTMYVDLDEIIEKEPKLLEVLGDGWDGIDDEVLIVDTPSEKDGRGYISFSKGEINKAFECYQKLKSYSKKLRDILK